MAPILKSSSTIFLSIVYFSKLLHKCSLRKVQDFCLTILPALFLLDSGSLRVLEKFLQDGNEHRSTTDSHSRTKDSLNLRMEPDSKVHLIR